MGYKNFTELKNKTFTTPEQTLLCSTEGSEKKEYVGNQGLYWPAFAPVVVSSLIAALGWWIASWHANTRERRKEARARLDKFSSDITAIIQISKKYLRLEGSTPEAKELALEIKLLFEGMDSDIEILRNTLSCNNGASEEYEYFFDKITGGSFESINREALSLEDELFYEQLRAGKLVVTTFEKSFSKKFDKTFMDQINE